MKYRVLASLLLILVLGIIYLAFDRPHSNGVDNNVAAPTQPSDDGAFKGLGK